MNFQTRKIGSEKPQRNPHQQNIESPPHPSEPPTKKIAKSHRLLILTSLCLATIILVFGGLYALFSQISLKSLVFSLGAELQTDYRNRTNFLLLGTGVKGINEASTLTDTIIVGSYNHDDGTVILLSIPRDLYVRNQKLGTGGRINEIYDTAKNRYSSEEAIQILEEEIEEITNLDIHYYAKINFNGLKQIVDILDGVDINVEQAINDPFYPKDGTSLYEPFYISAGRQTLDGETALKYSRSRKTTSDFDRAKRQQQVIFAIKEKAMQKEILSSPSKIKDLFGAVSDNLETDLSIREIIELASLSQDINREKINSYVLNDDPAQCGGFLYPPERELFGGAAVLLPITNKYDHIHRFVESILTRKSSGAQIQVLNGTKSPGMAATVKMKLQRYCFDVIRFGNARNQSVDNTSLYYKGETIPPEMEQIAHFVPGLITTEIPEKYFEPQYFSNANVIIEIGSDYIKNTERDIFLDYLYQPKAPSSTESTESTAATTATEAATE